MKMYLHGPHEDGIQLDLEQASIEVAENDTQSRLDST
jgi:chitinase